MELSPPRDMVLSLSAPGFFFDPGIGRLDLIVLKEEEIEDLIEEEEEGVAVCDDVIEVDTLLLLL
jgi:hypothetical protein